MFVESKNPRVSDFLSARDAAAYAGWSLRTLYRNLHAGLPSVKTPHGRRQFATSDIDEFKARHRVVAPVAPVHASRHMHASCYFDSRVEAARLRAMRRVMAEPQMEGEEGGDRP
jgi:hypothetical protein